MQGQRHPACSVSAGTELAPLPHPSDGRSQIGRQERRPAKSKNAKLEHCHILAIMAHGEEDHIACMVKRYRTCFDHAAGPVGAM